MFELEIRIGETEMTGKAETLFYLAREIEWAASNCVEWLELTPGQTTYVTVSAYLPRTNGPRMYTGTMAFFATKKGWTEPPVLQLC